MAENAPNSESNHFEEIVQSAQNLANENPQAYKSRVLFLALMGYAYLFMIVLFSIGGLGLFAYGLTFGSAATILLIKTKLFIPLALLVFFILRSLWVRVQAPHGFELTPENCPQIFALINEFRSKINGPPIHKVLLVNEFNAGISQVPRLGLFGWHKNYLILGFPLLLSITENEFKAILGHEYGHLSGNHGKFSSWIYRARRTWYQLMESLEAP